MEYLQQVFADAEGVIALIGGDHMLRIHFAPLLDQIDDKALVFFEDGLNCSDQILLHDIRAVAPLEDQDRYYLRLHVVQFLEPQKSREHLDDFAADSDLLFELRPLNDQIHGGLVRKIAQIFDNKL